MIDKDGIERPNEFNSHENEIKHTTRKVMFDDKYPYRPRNIFFRMWAATFRALAICVFNPWMKIKYHMVAFGRVPKNLRKKGFIISCNHVHWFDDLSIGTNLFVWRKVYFTTLDQNIRRPMVGFFLRSLGGIPIPAESLSGMKKFNYDISYLLQKGKPVMYNPEASLWLFYREIRPFKRGAFTMAVKNNVPVVPFVVLFKRKPKKNGKFKHKMYFAICNPVYPDKSLPERQRADKMLSEVYETTKRVASKWYEIQDCGFGDEKVHKKLKPKQLVFENDDWIVKEKRKKN